MEAYRADLARAGCKAEAVLLSLGHPRWVANANTTLQAGQARAMREAALLALAYAKALKGTRFAAGGVRSHRVTRRWGLN